MIKLIPFTKEHISLKYIAWFHDPEVCKYTENFESVWGKDDAAEWLHNTQEQGDQVYAILHAGDHIGNCAITNIDKVNSHAGMSFLIGDRGYWGKGIGTIVGQMLMAIGFTQMGLNKMWIGTLEDNVAMNTVAINLGFYNVNLFLEEKWYQDGYAHVLKYSMLKAEYLMMKNEK